MNNKNYTPGYNPPFFPMFLATGFGSGFFPFGPGTAGSVVALLIWLVLLHWLSVGVLTVLTLVLVVLFTLVGTWATAKVQPFWGDDPSRVVVDEMVGMWTALLAAPLFIAGQQLVLGLVALVLFRFFDIVKPLGIKRLDRRQGAFWVMADDLLGGFYALLILCVAGIILNFSS